MNHLQSFLRKTLPTSLVPFLISGSFYLLGGTIPKFTSEAYSSYIQFMLTMLFINIILKFSSQVLNSRVKEAQSSSFDFRSWTTEMLQEPSKITLKGFIIAVIQYSIAYGLYCALGLYISSLSCGSLVQCLGLPQESKISQSMGFSRVLSEENTNANADGPSRLAQEVGEFSALTPARKRELNSLSLSVGRVLSSLSIDAVSIALSSDGRIAYVSTRDRTLRIVDVNTLSAPSVIGSITLGPMSYTYIRKDLYLSPDGTTLFASNFQTLEIIDVTDPTAPVLLSTIKDENLPSDSDGAPVYKISMVFSDDQDTLYVAGLGFQIFHVADLSVPLLIKSTAKEDQTFSDLPVTSLAFDEEEEILYYADGSLKVFDCSEPTNLKQIGAYSLEYIHSVASPDDSKSIYITGSNGKDVILEKLNMTNPRYPKSISSYVLALDVDNGVLPLILSVNPEESHVFLFAGSESYSTVLFVFNLLKGKLVDNTKSLLPKAGSIHFLKDSNSIIAGYSDHFVTLELYLDYPNTRTYYLSNTTTAKFQPEGINTFILSPDGKNLWTMGVDRYRDTSQGSLEIFDVSNTSAPKRISSISMNKPCAAIQISFGTQRAVFPYYESYKVYDISNKKSLSLVGTIQLDSSQNIQDWVLSSDAKVGFVLQELGSSSGVTLRIFDFVKLVEIPNEILPQGDVNHRITLSKDNKFLFIIGPKLLVYDVSDLSNIKLLSDGEVGIDEPVIQACEVSADSKILLVVTLESGNVNLLRIYSVNEPNFPFLLSEFTLPQLGFEGSQIKPVISADSKMVSIFDGEGILQIDISNPQLPKAIGLVPIADSKDVVYQEFRMTQDGNTAFAVYKGQNVKVIDLQPRYSVFLNQESFPVGQKYSDNLAVFALNSTTKEYAPMDKQEFRFIKNNIHEIKIIPSNMTTQQILSQLPSWISIDKENNVATIEPKKSRDIGSYTIYTAFSRKIPFKAFSKIDDRIEIPEDLVAHLISLDYIDPQLFVTKNFGALKDFYLNSQFSDFKTEIYSLLKQYLIETCTTYDVAPSLSFIASERMFINTPSYNSIKVDMKLKADGGQARFLKKTYGSIEPVIFEDKSRIILEGPLKEVNIAIQQLAVDLNNTETCDATITITDNLNPSIVKYIPNVSNYFRINLLQTKSINIDKWIFFGAQRVNLPPVMNILGASEFQAQVDRQIIETGKYFVFELEKETFLDENSKSLTYSLTMQDKRKQMPSWLTLEGTTFKGTPPEEFFGRTIDLILHVSNEFKELQVTFKLSTSVSSTYLFKLLIKLSPYGLTALGLLISANKIYNVVYKKKYRHAKEFYVKVGEEITSEVIFPVLFTQEETGESERILSHLQKKVAKELHKKSVNSLQVAQYFVNSSTHELDRTNVMRVINEVVSGLKEHEQRSFKVYFNGVASRKLLVNQIVINQLVAWLLEADQATKNAFEKIKGEWPDMTEWTASGNFVANELKLESVLRGTQEVAVASSSQVADSEGANQRLLASEDGVNKDLLKNAIAGYALECQSLDMLAIRARILVKEKVGEDRIKGYLKMDLEDINFNERGRADYGIDYKIKNSALCFSGIVQEDFKGKTIVVQLTNLKSKILKEIWIAEESCKSGIDILSHQMISGHEEVARGQNYEVY